MKKREQKNCYIETYGCQMNKADSERMLGLLSQINYLPCEDPKDADLLILNTCTVREGAADRIFSNLGRWKRYKKEKPSLIIGISGCLAQERGQGVQKRMPYIDLVFGTHNLHRLPELVLQIERSGEKICELFEKLPEDLPEISETPIIRQNKVSAWVNVILGCNFNCTYCIVPSVRGREKSRLSKDIKKEVEELASEGFKEITLLGQNVTAYGLDLNEKSSLASLLREIHDIDGLERIRFLTGHPYHVDDELIKTVAELPKVCELFHIPMQSGDDEVLRRMARIYTSDYYLRMVDKIRNLIPDAHITGDFIVGFPGETHEQFMNTCKIAEKVKFASAMTAMYSPRKDTVAAKWEQDSSLKVSDEEKKERINMLNAIITDEAEKFAKRIYEGTEQEILLENTNFRDIGLFSGRTRGGKICFFENIYENTQEQSFKLGDLLAVEIKEITPWTLKSVPKKILK